MSIALPEFKAVLRRPRQAWRIPALQDHGSRNANASANGACLAQWEATTPEGRELFRKIYTWAATLCEQTEDTAQVVSEVQSRLERFPELHSEFTLIFVRLCGRKDATPGDLPIRDLAILMVMRIRLEQERANLSAQQHVPQEGIAAETRADGCTPSLQQLATVAS